MHLWREICLLWTVCLGRCLALRLDGIVFDTRPAPNLVTAAHTTYWNNSQTMDYQAGPPAIESPQLHTNESEWCVLWEETCHGNASLAVEDLFGDLDTAITCASNQTEQSCDRSGNLGGLQYADAFEKWMRSTACVAKASQWNKNHPGNLTNYQVSNESCCGLCEVHGAGVELFYWPQPDADYSCLDIIGTSELALDAGATTTTDRIGYPITYWGCTLRNPVGAYSDTYTAYSGSKPYTTWFDVHSGSSVVQTARLTESSGYKWRMPLVNPWDPPDCIDMPRTMNLSESAARVSNQGQWTNASSTTRQSFIPRPGNNSVTTAVLDGTTL